MSFALNGSGAGRRCADTGGHPTRQAPAPRRSGTASWARPWSGCWLVVRLWMTLRWPGALPRRRAASDLGRRLVPRREPPRGSPAPHVHAAFGELRLALSQDPPQVLHRAAWRTPRRASTLGRKRRDDCAPRLRQASALVARMRPLLRGAGVPDAERIRRLYHTVGATPPVCPMCVSQPPSPVRVGGHGEMGCVCGAYDGGSPRRRRELGALPSPPDGRLCAPQPCRTVVDDLPCGVPRVARPLGAPSGVPSCAGGCLAGSPARYRMSRPRLPCAPAGAISSEARRARRRMRCSLGLAHRGRMLRPRLPCAPAVAIPAEVGRTR